MASKMTGLHIAKGDRLRLETPGGGGYGPPSERSADAIARDLALGYVTKAAAARDYPAQTKDGAQ
jgi:N-methylhydantoinase B